jgi:uncharacterized protein YceH (UPF0502 family)
MLTILNNTEMRVLGSLVEKQVTTPEYYPLTLNALTQACNQKNNREPVVAFTEQTVTAAIETLRDKNLVYVFYGSGSRVPKYKHMMREVYELADHELAIINVMMLRGAQTVGELATRAGRLHEFSGNAEIEMTLNDLMNREPDSLVARLPRQPGHKEARYVQLLSGETIAASIAKLEESASEQHGRLNANERITQLEHAIEILNEEVKTLRGQLEDFKNQFS